MLRKSFALLLMVASSTSVAFSTCSFGQLIQNYKYIIEQWERNPTGEAEPGDLLENCFRQLRQINISYDQAYYYLAFENNLSSCSKN